MAKKIKFPLRMKNGAEVRDMEALRENFDIESVTEYFINGTLARWLDVYYYDDVLQKIQGLKKEDDDFGRKLANALGVDWDDKAQTNLHSFMKATELKEKLRPYISGEELEKIQYIADTQQELERLAGKGCTPIYLFGEAFRIKRWMGYMECIGLNSPVISLEIESREEFQKRKIKLTDVEYADKKMKEIVSGNTGTELYQGLLDGLGKYLTAVQENMD